MADFANSYPHIISFGKNADARLEKAISSYLDISGPNGIRPDISSSIPSLPFSLAEIKIRTAFATNICRSIVFNPSSKYVLYPKDTLTKINAGCKSANNEISNILNNVETHENRKDGIQNLDTENHVTSYQDGYAIDFANTFRGLDSSVDVVILNASNIGHHIRKDGFNPISIAISDLSDSLEDVFEKKEQARVAARTARARATDADKQLKSIMDIVTKINEDAIRSANNSEKIQATKNQIDALQEAINETRAKAEEADRVANSFLEKFEKFDQSAEQRQRFFNDQENQVKALTSSLKDANEYAERTIEETRIALNLGTANGLSSAFQKSEERLFWPTLGLAGLFVLSVAFLTWLIFAAVKPSIVPLVPDGLVPELPDRIAEIGRGGYSIYDSILTISDLGIRFLIILPGILAVRFSMKVLESSLLARRQYTFKSTIAAALPSFKQQVDDAGDGNLGAALSLRTFEAITENPDKLLLRQQRRSKDDDDDGFAALYRYIRQMLQSSRGG